MREIPYVTVLNRLIRLIIHIIYIALTFEFLLQVCSERSHVTRCDNMWDFLPEDDGKECPIVLRSLCWLVLNTLIVYVVIRSISTVNDIEQGHDLNCDRVDGEIWHVIWKICKNVSLFLYVHRKSKKDY